MARRRQVNFEWAEIALLDAWRAAWREGGGRIAGGASIFSSRTANIANHLGTYDTDGMLSVLIQVDPITRVTVTFVLPVSGASAVNRNWYDELGDGTIVDVTQLAAVAPGLPQPCRRGIAHLGDAPPAEEAIELDPPEPSWDDPDDPSPGSPARPLEATDAVARVPAEVCAASPDPGSAVPVTPAAGTRRLSPREENMSPEIPAPPRSSGLAVSTFFWTILGGLGLGGVLTLGVGYAAEFRDDARIATLAVGLLGGLGYLGLAQIFLASLRVRRRAGDVLWSVERLAEGGGSLPDCANFARGSGDDAVGELNGQVNVASNVQILAGMAATAVYLALEARVFFEARDALAASDSAVLAAKVAPLLGLGPKAFLSTAVAVVSSMIVGFAGNRQVLSLRGALPTDQRVIETWHHGHARWEALEFANAEARERKILDAALSNRSVQELNAALRDAARIFAGLEGTVAGFNQAAVRIASVQGTLEELTRSIQASDVKAKTVAEGLTAVAKEVKDNSDAMLRQSQEFAQALSQHARDEGTKLIGESISRTMTIMEPEFKRLATNLHDSMARSSESITDQAARQFSASVANSQVELQEVDRVVGAFRGNMGGLVADMKRWATELDRNSGELRSALATAGTALTLDPSGRTAPALQALETTRRQLEASANRMAAATSELARAMEAVRRNAEIVGRLREVSRTVGRSE